MAIKKVVKMSAAPKKSDPGKGMKGVVKGVMNAGKVVKRVKQGSKPLMEKREGRTGETNRRNSEES